MPYDLPDVLEVTADGPVRIIRLNRPEQMNAFDDDLHHGFASLWAQVERDTDVRAAVITGNGRAFCAGGNIDDFELFHRDFAVRRRKMREARRLVDDMLNVHVPVVAAVNGPAVGLGATLMTLCDVVYIAESTYVADPHVASALVAGDGGAVTWPAYTSLLKAKQYLLTGDRIPAPEALALGLANFVVPARAGRGRRRRVRPSPGVVAAAAGAGHQGSCSTRSSATTPCSRSATGWRRRASRTTRRSTWRSPSSSVKGSLEMRDVVVLDAVRTPVGKRNGSLAGVHANDLLGAVQRAVVERTGIDPGAIGQVVGGCVQQVGTQSGNVTRNAWLAAGLPLEVPATTVNVQCGSSQQATTLAHALVAGGLVDVALACGVETMSAVPMGSSTKDEALGLPRAGTYAEQYEATTQFQGADRIARQWGISRFDTEVFGKRSQDLAAAAWAEGRFDGQLVPVAGLERDEGLRATSLEALSGLRTNLPDPDAVHTAGTSSQIADGAAAVLLTTRERADALGLRPRARVVDSVLVGSDPVLMLTGPIPATQRLLERTGLRLDDIDLFEVNEAFASVVLAWAKETGADLGRTNPNGGAIALGHPLGGTGCILLTKALHELERTGGRHALVTMCCGGGLGTGTIIERLE